jgi:hypothetical protein
MVDREGLTELAERLSNFVEVISDLDARGWTNIFDH